MSKGVGSNRRALLGLACALLLPAGVGGAADARPRRHAAEPVVVELYTAQGCSTCPKADGVIAEIVARKSVIPLTFSVDYWDYLGWEDTLAKPEFAARQRAYLGRLKVREIYTPEIVVQGAAEGSALDHATVDGLIKAAEAQRRRSPHIRFLRHDARVRITGGGERGEVWLVRFDPAPQTVRVKAGENRGQTVTVTNAVRELKRVGVWKGGAKTYALPKAEEKGLRTVVLVQAPKGGRILAAAQG
jgi:hypothetical protein